ncbi:TetR/AcrR family transcriptional regulator [Streptomyces cavernicola]|uniref:TetR/AcrR family transcriptional regulator n=1 Tax=Streptomyces cavernicola TaxID=3043613 RepID=A0ABT6S6B8_9ACTN|nr:TetR/AcrR family transcriptional regulator [Streptomyces sp. B-S-A6]MDI3403641.1 TetR/AcrR family transcriptional regulator [Streptomyces sp. B-S-A6]
MAPRGVAIPDARERLFAAAERVLERDGPGALTSRAVTDEAGCSKGLLHTHFAGLDAFVAELCLDRFARAAHQASELPARAGEGAVAATLGSVALALLRSGGPTISALALSRPAATLRVRQALESGAPGFDAIEAAIAAYLDAEQRLGRIAPTLDTAAAALAVVGAVHHLLMTAHPGGPDPQERIERLVELLVSQAE